MNNSFDEMLLRIQHGLYARCLCKVAFFREAGTAMFTLDRRAFGARVRFSKRSAFALSVNRN
jgi:hypothetical protein